MFFHIDIKADGLPTGTVCLTYDDGPGPRTAELAGYLAGRGIAATFFVIGRHAEGQDQLLGQLRRWGHLIGNHTYSHPGLANLAASGGDVVEEVARTDAILAPYFETGMRFLRPPYGNWRETEGSDGERRDRPESIVARALNRDGRFRDYVGPINWDISGQDYDFWRQGLPAEDCARRYLDRIREIGRGMILLHDSSEDPEMRRHNRTDEVTRILVPILESEGFRFVRLDEIPQVRSAMRVSSVVALRSDDGRYLGWTDEPRGRIVDVARSVGQREQFGVVPLDSGRVALRATSGFYLAERPGPERVSEEATGVTRRVLCEHRGIAGARGSVLTEHPTAPIRRPPPFAVFAEAESLDEALAFAAEQEGDRFVVQLSDEAREGRFTAQDLFQGSAEDAGSGSVTAQPPR